MKQIVLNSCAWATERNHCASQNSTESCHHQLPSAAAASFKLTSAPVSLCWWSACCLVISPHRLFCCDLLPSLALETSEVKKKKKYRAAHSVWPYSLQMSSTWTILQPCHIPRAYTWPCPLTFPEKTHKFSVRLKPDNDAESLFSLPPPRRRIYGDIPFNTPLGLCMPIHFLIYHLSYSFTYKSIY